MTHNDVHEVTRRDIFRQVLAKQRKNSNGCISLPVNIVFFVVYAVAARLHEDITNVWVLESSLRNLFLPDLVNLETVEDVWDWLMTSFADELFVQSDDYGVPLPSNEWSRVLTYSQVQGSVLLTQSRETDATWGKAYVAPSAFPGASQAANMAAIPQRIKDLLETNEGFKSRSSEGRRLDLMKPSLLPALPGASDEEATYDFPLYPFQEKSQILAELQYLKSRRWFDENTKRLEIKALLINCELGRPRLEQVVIKLSFSRGGNVYAGMTLQALFLKSHDTILSMGMDALFFIMLFAKSLIYLRELWMSFTQSTLKTHLSMGTTVLEWIIIACGWLNVAGFVLQESELKGVNSSLERLRGLPRTATMEEQGQISAQLHDDAESLILVYEYWRLGLAWYTIILIFRFFAAFRAQPRLAVVTNTLRATFMDLVHFLVVFIPTFIAYAVSGNLLFGRRIENFSTVQASIGVCLRVVFENEYEWLLLSQEHFATAAIWTWSLLIIVVLVMLNLVLAIILDIYNEVRSNTNSADTIFLFMKNVAKRLSHLGQWVKDKDLQCVLIDMDDHSTLSRTDLCEALPNLTALQRDMIFDACRVEMAWQAKQDIKRQEFLKLAASIKLSIDQANELLGTLEEEENELLGQEHLPTIKEAQAARMHGASRPFPGMPCTPGGYFPPILPPTKERPDIMVPPLDLPGDTDLPSWYLEMKQALGTSCDLMTAIKYEVETLQWVWYQLNEIYRPSSGPPDAEAIGRTSSDGNNGMFGATLASLPKSLTRTSSKMLA